MRTVTQTSEMPARAFDSTVQLYTNLPSAPVAAAILCCRVPSGYVTTTCTTDDPPVPRGTVMVWTSPGRTQSSEIVITNG